MKMLFDFILSRTLRCAYATLARMRSLALYLVLIAALSTTAFASVTITTAPTSVKSGNTADIAATVSSSLTVSSVYLWFNLSGSLEVEEGWNFIPMTLDSGTTYKGIIPIVPAGTLTWYVKATYSDGSTESSSTKTTTIEYQMDYGRYHDNRRVNGTTDSAYYVPTYGWRQDTTTGGSMSTNFYATAPNGTQWKAHAVGWSYQNANRTDIPRFLSTGQTIIGGDGYGLPYPVLYFYNIRTEHMPFIRTPRLDGGLGTFSFDLRNVVGTSSKIMIQITRKENPSDSSDDWINVQEYSLTSDSESYHITNIINDISVTYARILRTEINTAASGLAAFRTGFIGIDNIAASLPPPDVILKERLRRPGYPSLSEDVTVRCVVSNKYSHTPAMNKKVSVYYSLSSAVDATIEHGWYSTNMNYVCEVDGGSLFEGTIPAQPQTGYMHYYFRCDFEGYYYITKENSNIPTPKFYYNKTTTTPPGNTPPHLVYEVRSFRSRYGQVKLLQNINGGEPRYYDMSLTGHNEWQVTAPVPASSVSAAYFMGMQCYFDEATSFSPIAFFYGDENQQEPYETPTGGRPERVHGPVTNDLPQITINVANEGYLLYRLNDSLDDTELSYTIKRGIYQDFNTWYGDRDYYTKSLYGSAIGIYEDPIDGWRTTLAYTPNDTIRLDFTSEVAESEYNNSEDVLSNTGWYRTGAMIGSDRITNTTATAAGTAYRNVYAKLKTQVGRLRNTGSVLAMPPGVGTVSARMRSAVEAGHFALYNAANAWTYDHTSTAESQLNIKTVFRIPSEARPKTPYYASIVFNYVDANNYHEFRVVRCDSGDAYDRRLQIQFCRCVDGVVTVLNSATTSNYNEISSDTEITLNLRVRNYNASSRRTVVSFYLSTGSRRLWNYSSWTEGTALAVFANGGKVGLGAYDCSPRFTSFQVYGGTSGQSYSAATGTGEDSFYATADNWSLGGVDSTHSVGSTTAYRWYVDSADGYTLKRRIPMNIVNIYTAPRTGSETTPPAASQYTLVGSVPLESLELGYYSWDIHSWQDMFVDFRVADRDGDTGDGYVVIDDVVITPWRAYSRTPTVRSPISESGLSSYQWTTEEEQYDFCFTYPDTWITLEAWAVTNRIGVGADAVESVMIRLDHTQANTNIAQAVVTPILTNGIGTVKFDFYVTTSSSAASAQSGKVVYAIEYTSDGNLAGWGNVAVVYTNYVGESGFHSYEIGVNYHSDARARIRVLNETDRDVILWLDNLYVNDFPEATENMWKVYNGCITDLGHGDNTRLFDIAGRTLYLNDSPSEGLAPRQEEELDEHLPYLQSPKVPEGIGEISFMYRTYDASEPGYIAVDVAADESLPDEQWLNLTNFVVNGTGYVKFEDPMIYQKTNFFVRIHTVTNGLYGRVCIDNVLVTEKARAQYDIAKVWLTPEQPMISETNVTVYAEINREIQNPTGIRLFVSYIVGTNNWGYANWWHEAWSRKIEMYRVGVSSVFKTPTGTGLPSKPANGTIQYVVWGIHNAIPVDYTFDDVLFQKEFINPSWYGSIDYNEFNKESGFSPYYFIYSCAKGAVWINEVWSHRAGTEDGYEYVELAGRSGVDISGWKIKTYKKISSEPYESENTIVIPQNTKIPNDESGWGFYVLGDPGTTNVDYATESTLVDERDFFFDRGYNPIGIELCRDTGITEQRIVVANTDTTTKIGIMAELGFSWLHIFKSSDEYGFSYSLLDSFTHPDGEYHEDGYLCFTNDFVSVDGVSKVWTWGFGTPTPGAINKDMSAVVNQTFAPVIVGPGFTLASYIASANPYGTQNGQMTEINVTVDSGASTSIVYVAKSWYKIVALTSNGTTVSDAAGKSSYTFNISSMSADVENTVTFGPKTASDYSSESDENKRWSDQILDWFRTKGWTEAQIEAGDGDEYTVQEEYLLNTSPILTTEVENITSGISTSADGVTLTLKLARSDNGVAVTDAVNGTVNIYGKESLTDTSWSKIGSAGISTGAFSGTETATTSTIDSETLGFKFFIWKLE